MTWFAVDCDIATNKKIWKLAERLAAVPRTDRGRSAANYENDAIAYVVKILAELPRHAPDGCLGAVSDTLLERWAHWRGDPGGLATAFRELFVTDGVVTGWGERNLPIIKHRERERERSAARRKGENTENRPRTDRAPTAQRPEATDTDTDTVTTSLARKRSSKKAAIQVVPVLSPDGEPWQDWLGVLAAAWDEVNGTGSFPFGQAVRAFKPLHAKQGAKDLASRLRAYLTQNPAKFHNIQKFATTFQNYRDWSKERPIGDDGKPTAAYHDWMAAGCP